MKRIAPLFVFSASLFLGTAPYSEAPHRIPLRAASVADTYLLMARLRSGVIAIRRGASQLCRQTRPSRSAARSHQ
jgi:hypothetical protein